MALGGVPNVSEPFLTTTILWIFKPSQFYEAYPLTLIPCRKGNWLHVGSTPTASTHSRIATLIVGRNGRAYDGSGVATAKRSRKRMSKLPMVEVELIVITFKVDWNKYWRSWNNSHGKSNEEAKPSVFRGHKLFENKPKLPMVQWSSVKFMADMWGSWIVVFIGFLSEFLLCVLSVKIGRIFRF